MTELAILQDLTPAVVFAPGGGDPIVEKIRQEVLAVDRDISTEDGRKNVASLAYKVAKSKTFLDEVGKTFAADLKTKVKAIDTERGRIWDALEALQKEVRQPLTEFEDAEKNRIDFMERTILHIINCGMGMIGDSPQPIGICLHELEEKIVIDESFKEFKERAFKARDESIAKLRAALEKQMKEAADREELERLRKAEAERLQRDREERLKAEAAEHARHEAEAKAKREADEAAHKAEQEKQRIHAEKEAAERKTAEAIAAQRAAEEKARSDLLRSEQARKEAEEKAERDKQEAITRERNRIEAKQMAEKEAAEKREADHKHKAKINNAALKALVSAGLTEDHARLAIEAIAKRQVPHVTISY